MSLRCYFGYCHRTSDPLLRGIPAGISGLENEILSRLGLTLNGIVNQGNYHAYLTMTRITTDGNLQRVWQEYLHFPAPTATGRRSQPVQTGDQSLAFFLNSRNVLPGGWVSHIVRPEIPAIANVTQRMHFLYPGYIIRWLETEADNAVVSYTLGRGIGMLPETNENKGSEMFMDLDQRIIESLNSR